MRPESYKQTVDCCYNCHHCLLSVWDSYYCLFGQFVSNLEKLGTTELNKMHVDPDGICKQYKRER
jgi:hypothetical protein